MITIYSKENCPWCDKAKKLLARHELEYQEKVFPKDFTREELIDLTGKTTVPQMWSDDYYIGGYEDLYAILTTEGNKI